MPRRGESIYKRKDGRWEARYVKGIDSNGKKVYGSVYAKTYRDVKEKQRFFLMHKKLPNNQNKHLTIQRIIEEWLEDNKNQLKPSTKQKYISLSYNHIIPSLGHVDLDYLTRKTIIDFTSQQLLKGKVNGGSLTSKTVNDILIVLKMALNYASKTYNINIPTITLLKEKKKIANVLSIPDQQRLISYLLEDMDVYKFGVLLALYTGMRIGELCALKWEDINCEHIIVNKTMQRLSTNNGKSEITIGEPKSDSSCRIIPIFTMLRPYINLFRKPSGYVLQYEDVKFVEPRLMQVHFRRIIHHAGLKDTNFHTLRHTFATRCIEADFDIKTLSEILGHSDVKTTLNLYVHSSYQFKQLNIEKLSLHPFLQIDKTNVDA